MKKIVLIGAGQLGSRHLQGIAKSEIPISIEVVEPFAGSRETAKLRFEEIPSNTNIKNISFYESINQLSNELDLVIIATNADVRFKIIEELLKSRKVFNLVLEKVLFQKIEEYKLTDKLLKESNTKCWVNHPRRMFPFYQKLKKELKNASRIHFNISGGNWRLGCNGLHFLDCFSFLCENNNLELNLNLLEKEIYETKRSGFKEVNGLLCGNFDKSTFSINCFPNNLSPVQFNITSDTLNILIDETSGWYKISEKNNNWENIEDKEKIIYFQSELTNLLINDIFNNDCKLPTYDEAMKLHLIYLTNIINHINTFSNTKYDYCPIT